MPKETRVIRGLSEAYVRLMLRCITMSVGRGAHFRTFGGSGRIQGVESGFNLTSNVFRVSPPSKTGPLVGAGSLGGVQEGSRRQPRIDKVLGITGSNLSTISAAEVGERR